MSHDHRETPECQTIACLARASRRRLLTMLAAAPAALGILITGEPPPVTAKKRKGTKRKKKNKSKKRKNRNRKKSGGGYAPDKEERAFLDLINAYRRDKGVGALSLNDQLGAAARHHSQDMAKKNYFKHTLSNGDSAEENIRRHGYTNYRHVGENIAAGFASANDAFKAWKDSPSHNKNMLSKNFTEIGIGRASSKKGKYDWYWTTTFGSR